MPTSISAFPIQQEYPRNLPAASFPGGDDVLLIDGPTNGTRALSAAIISQLSASRLTANMPVYDGTQGRTTATTGLTTTTDPVWVCAVKQVTSTTESGNLTYTSSSPSNAGCLALQLNNSVPVLTLVTTAGGYIQAVGTALTVGWHRIRAGLVAGVPFITVDGVAQTLTINIVGGGTWAQAVDISSVDNGAAPLVGACASFVGTGTWSASDISDYFATGALPAWAQYPGGAGQQLITGNDSTGAVDTGFWIKANGATISSGFSLPAAGYVARNALLVPGKQYRITVQNTGAGDIYLNVGPSNVIIGTGAGTYAYDCTPTAATLFVGSNAGTTASLITVETLGTIAGMDPGHDGQGYQWPDVSGGRNDFTLPSSGWTPLRAPSGGRVHTLFATTSSSVNQQILGQVALPANAKIISWDINSAGTPTVSLGNASGATTYANAVVLTAGQNALTVTAPFASTQNLWVSSSTTALLKHAIRYVLAY